MMNDFDYSDAYGVNSDFRIIGGKPVKLGEFRGQVRNRILNETIPEIPLIFAFYL